MPKLYKKKFNSNRSEDIVIGSPMFKKDTENYEIGRIDIYIREKKEKGFTFKNIKINGFKPKSRFGNTLAKLGDVNDDGFNGSSNKKKFLNLNFFVDLFIFSFKF